MLHYLYTILAFFALSQIYAPEFFDSLIARLVPLYGFCVVCVFVSYFRYHKEPVTQATRREYVFKKPGQKSAPKSSAKAGSGSAAPAAAAGSWKQEFVGTWDKVERPGFKEFAMFVGNNSFVASYAEKQPCGSIIQFKDSSEKEMKLDTTGTPAQPGAWCVLGGDAVESKDPKGKVIMEKMWWDESKKQLCRSLNSPEGDMAGNDMTQIREIRPDGKLVSYSKITRRKDGQSCEFTTISKRV